MSEDIDKRVTALEYKVENLEKELHEHGTDMSAVKQDVNKILGIVQKVQYVAYGIMVYFLFDTFGLTKALKFAIGV